MKEEWTGAPNSSQLSNTRSKVKEDKMNRNRLLNKYLLLALILTALFAMTGCRTRITNNSEVSNVYYDEDGFLSETYQMRRDELGLSTAESPIFPDLGSGDTEDDFDSSEESGLNYEPEEDTYVEPPTTSTTTPSTTHRYSTPGRRYSSPSTTTTTKVKIIFDPGKGHIGSKKAGETSEEEFTMNSTFTTITATWDGHELKGWKPSDGSKNVGVGERVKATKDLKYTAVWDSPNKEPSSQEVKSHKIVFIGNGGTTPSSVKVEDGKSYTIKESSTKKDNTFVGWKDNSTDKIYKTGDTIKDIKKGINLTAQWTPNKKSITISFDSNGGSNVEPRTVNEGEKIGTLPKSTWKGHHFEGWYIGDEEITKDTVATSSNKPVTAKWSDWFDLFNKEASDEDIDDKNCIIVDSETGEITTNGESFVNDSRGIIDESSYSYVITFANDPKAAVENLRNKEGIKGKKIISLSSNALNSDDDYERLLYNIVLLNKLHDRLDIGEAQTDIEIKADYKVK